MSKLNSGFAQHFFPRLKNMNGTKIKWQFEIIEIPWSLQYSLRPPPLRPIDSLFSMPFQNAISSWPDSHKNCPTYVRRTHTHTHTHKHTHTAYTALPYLGNKNWQLLWIGLAGLIIVITHPRFATGLGVWNLLDRLVPHGNSRPYTSKLEVYV